MGRRRDELADLAYDFDRMAERLQYLVEARDRLLHDVSHELRSPLARLSLAVALLRQRQGSNESLDRIDVEVTRLDALVGELLSLSRTENGMAELDAYFDLTELVRSVVADAQFEAQQVHIALMLDVQYLGILILRGSAGFVERWIMSFETRSTYQPAGKQSRSRYNSRPKMSRG